MRHPLLLAIVLSQTVLQAGAALTVSTDFESGSAKVLELDAKAQTIRISPAGNPERGMPNWWYLRFDGIDTNQPVILEVVALDVSTPTEGNAEGKSAPLNPGWTLPARATFSTNGTTWDQTAPGERDGKHCTYRITTTSSTLWLAWGPPFTPRDAMAFVEKMAKAHPFAKTFMLATSREGRSVPGLDICEGDKPLKQRPAVWVIGRQHAWEVGGSWVTAGFAEWLAGDDEPAKWLRQNAEVVFVPLMDVDHVATGDGGKHARPQDHNRDWSDAPHWPEVAAAQKRISEFAKDGRMSVFLDVHNPSPGATSPAFYRDYPPYAGPEASAREDVFLSIAKDVLGEIRIIDGKPPKPELLPVWRRISTPWVLEHGNPQTVSFTAEIPWNIPTGMPDGYRVTGQKLGQTVEKYLRHESK